MGQYFSECALLASATMGDRSVAGHCIIDKPNLQVSFNSELIVVNNINAKTNLNPSNTDLI